MAVKPTLDLFGGLNLFQTPQVTLDREVASLFETSKMSAAAQEAYNEMQARAKVNAQNAENVLKQQEAYQQQVAREHEESTRRLAEAIKERQRREEEARKEAEKAAKEAEKAKKEQAKALEKDPTLLVKSNISAFLEDESYKKAGDLRRAHMMRAEAAKITEALKAQGHDEATIKKSVSAFEAAVQSDINRYKKEADSGFFRAAWDVISSVGSAFNNVQTGNASRDGQLITEAASDLLSGKTASGWAFDEISDRIPRAKWKKYVEKETNWGLDSFSSFRLRPGLTAAEKAEFSALVNEALKGTEQDLAKHTKERDFWQSQQSAEQQREMDNMAFEKEQAAAKYDNKEPPFLSSEWFSQALEMASISAKYPNTMLVDQSGNLLIEVGASAVATAVQGTATAALAATGVGVPAAIATGIGTGATAVRVANGLAKFGKALTKLPSTATGMAVAGKLTASDTINSARETILQADTAKLAESNPELWQQLLELSGGNEELAKQRLATMKAGDQYSQAFVLGAATHIIGPEALLARATTRALSRTAAEAARTSVGGTVARAVVSTASEGVEEGYTQYLTNKAIASALPDHDLMTGVADAVGSGIAVGGMVSGVAGATSLYGNARTAVEREQRASAIEVLSNENVQVREEQYASVTNFKDLRSTIVTQMEDFERENSQAFANDPETLKQNRQAYYDTLVDTPSVMGRLSVSEQRELREVVKQAFNGTVNTNPYAPAQDTPFMQALRNKEETPQGETIADVWRLVHNKDLGNVKNVRLATSLHKLYAELFPNQKAVDETTRQRADRLITIVNKMAEDDPTLSDAEKTTLLRTSAVLFDSNRRRLGEHDATTQNEATRAGTNQRTPETDGTGRADKGSTTSTQEPSPTANRGQATANSESGGDGGTQQTTESSSSTGATTADSTSPVQDVSGAREAPQTETPTDPAGTPNVFSETPASTGSAEPATESSGPVIVTNAPATTTSTGSGVVGDTTTERSADGTSITPATETNTLDDAIYKQIYSELKQDYQIAIDLVVTGSDGAFTTDGVVKGFVDNREDLSTYAGTLAGHRKPQFRKSARGKLVTVGKEVVKKYDKLRNQPELPLDAVETTTDTTQEGGIRPTTPDELRTAYAAYIDKPDISDVVTFTTKSGSSVILEHSVGKTSSKDGVTTHYFSVVGVDGTNIGDLTIHNDPKSYPQGAEYSDGTFVVKRALLDTKYQKRGIGTALYNFAEARLNTQLMPSTRMTPQAQAMWARWKGEDWLNTYNLTAEGNDISAVKEPRLTSKTKQEKPNETQNATSEQSTPAEVTAIENGQNDVGDVSSTDDKAGTVRGPNPKKTGSAQRETPDEVTEGNDDSDTKSDNSEARAEPEQGKSATKTTPKKTGEAPKTVSESDVTKQPAEGATLTNDIATLEGTTPSEQVAVVLPLPANDGTAVTRVNVPEGTHTDAEQRADAIFDTEYSDERSAEGYSMADIALALAEAAGVFSSEPVETVRLRSRKKGNGPQTTQAKQKRAKHKARKDKVYANENELIDAVNEQLREITNEQNNNMAEWLQFLSETDNNRQLAKFFSVFVPFKNEIDDIMMDTSHHAARAKITDYWWWDKKRGKPELEGKKFGVVTSLGQKVGSHLAGITPLLDDYMNKLGPDVVPRTGVAQDSSVVSVSLAKIEGTKQTVYGHIHNAYVQPVIDILSDMTAKYPDADTLSTDFGNYANYRHMRVSGVEHFFRNGSLQKSEYAKKLEERLNELSRFKANNLDAILTDDSAAHTFANTLDGSEKTEFNSLLKRYKVLKKDADKHDKDFELSRKVFYGEVPRSDYPNVKLPNGMTQAELNEDMKALEAKYSKEDLDKVAELIYRGFSGIRVTGAGFGVHDSAALKHFNDAKLKDYVYLGHTKEDNPNEFEEQVIAPAIFDYLDDVTISEQYETLGLAKDLSRYSRQGSRTRADDAITNLGRSARNMAGRAASQEFEQNIQRLFEGTLASDNTDAVPTPDTVKSYKRSIVQKGAVDGIVRIRADLPSKHIPKEFSTIVPLTAKGWDYNDNGERELVTYRYYFTDPRIQNELTHKVTVDSTFDKNKIISSMRSLTRIKASFMTARNPVWNFWNFENEYWERMTTIALRPVVNDEGKRVSGTKLAMSFTKEIGALSVDLGAQREIYDYLTTRERRTPLQQELHRLYLSGTIQLMTDLTDKFDFLGEQERSPVDNFINNVSKATQRQAKKSALAGKVVEGASDFSDWYHRRIAEVPQVVSALAMHRAYRQNGVNRAEANHRVRDMFDPMRTKSNFMQRLANFFPFIRSAGAGNYNTMRTFGDVFMRDGWKGKAKLAVLASANVGVLFALSALSYREDEDGNDILAQMSLTDLARGIPIKLSDDTVLFIPTGHGVARFMWGVAVAVYKWLHGTISEMEVTTHIAEMTLKNISPLQLPTEESLSASGGETVALSMVPNLMLPVAEVLMNRDTFSGREIISSRTPSGERDSDQDNFATPETFKDGAKTLFKGTGGTLDVRPETLHHLAKNTLNVGPFRAIDAVLQDKGEKTQGGFMSKGEAIGPLATLLGIGTGVSTHTLSVEGRYFDLVDATNSVLSKYNVPRTMPSGATYEKTDISDISMHHVNLDRDTRAERVAHQLKLAGASREEIQLAVNMLATEQKVKDAKNDMRTKGLSVYNSSRKGTETPYTQEDVVQSVDAVKNLYRDLVIENNQFAYGKK